MGTIAELREKSPLMASAILNENGYKRIASTINNYFSRYSYEDGLEHEEFFGTLLITTQVHTEGRFEIVTEHLGKALKEWNITSIDYTINVVDEDGERYIEIEDEIKKYLTK